MRNILLIAAFLIIHVAFSQGDILNTRVSIQKSGQVREILEEITARTGVAFNFNENMSGLSSQKQISGQYQTLGDVLNQLFRGTGITYTVQGNTISLRNTGQGEEGIRVTGFVYDSFGDPIPGVNVRIKDTYLGTITTVDGKFGIKVPAGSSNILVFSYVGLQTKEVQVSSDSEIRVDMEDDITTLDQVVVTGYNIEKNRTELVGSISQVSSQDIQAERPVESFEKLLAGKVAGVQIEFNGGGEAGVPVSVKIRGQGTLIQTGQFSRSTSSEPLYILDGVPMYDITENQVVQSATINEQRLNPLASLNPADIESVTVLKDAAASAIYGANAANGVIIITTKRGQSGKMKVDADVTYGFSTPMNFVKLLNSEDYVTLFREALIGGGMSVEDATEQAGSAEIYTKWEEIALRNAAYRSANLSVSGGSDKIRLRTSLNYMGQQTIAIGNDYNRFGIRTNADFSFTEKFSATYNSMISFHTKESLNTFSAQNFPPNVSPYNEDGTLNEEGFFLVRPNPVSVLEQNENSHLGLSVNTSLRFNYLVTPSFKLSWLGGVDFYTNRQTRFDSGLNASGRNNNGELTLIDRRNQKWISNVQARWGKKVGSFNLSTLGGFEIQQQVTFLLRGYGTDFTYDKLRTLQSANESISASATDYVNTLSGFAEASIDYRAKYFLSVNARRDASSIFGGDVRSANFASIGLSWNISEEDFMSSLDWINLMKFRTSYGSTGNSRIGTYASRGLYSIDLSNGYNGQIGALPISAENTNLTWEKNLKFNAGLDFTLFETASIGIEYYRNNILDAIGTIDVPVESGFSSAEYNTADMRNTGIEITLGYRFFTGKSIQWNTSFNTAFNRNIVTDLKLKDEEISTISSLGLKEGVDVRTIYGMPYAGVDPETGERLWYLIDGTITSDLSVANDLEHRIPIGTRNPKFYGGFFNSVEYGAFDLSIGTSYSFGSDILVNNFYETDGRQIAFLNQSVNQLDRWQQPGDITQIPKLSTLNGAAANSSRYLYNLDFIKIEYVKLTYRFYSELLDKWSLSAASAFISANNLGYWYFDDTPSNRNGVAEYRFSFPESRSFTVGLKIGF